MQNDNTTIGGMDEDFLKAFKFNGNLNIITEYLRDKNKKLTFSYSSQNKNVFLMFYNKSLFWKIRRLKLDGKVQYKITFNFNYARYMTNWRSVKSGFTLGCAPIALVIIFLFSWLRACSLLIPPIRTISSTKEWSMVICLISSLTR